MKMEDNMKIEYNKLIRDRIPEIIEAEGKTAVVEIIVGDRLLVELNKKLVEELAEYQESGDVEELADIFEVIKGILQFKGVQEDEFMKIVGRKVEKRGGFEKGLFLVEVE